MRLPWESNECSRTAPSRPTTRVTLLVVVVGEPHRPAQTVDQGGEVPPLVVGEGVAGAVDRVGDQRRAELGVLVAGGATHLVGLLHDAAVVVVDVEGEPDAVGIGHRRDQAAEHAVGDGSLATLGGDEDPVGRRSGTTPCGRRWWPPRRPGCRAHPNDTLRPERVSDISTTRSRSSRRTTRVAAPPTPPVKRPSSSKCQDFV